MELYIPQERAGRNAQTGQFLPGNSPHNKGKHWSDYMGKRAQKRAARGWKNIVEHPGPGNTGRLGEQSQTQVVAVGYRGNWLVFPSCTKAAEWIGSTASNISRCCRWNRDQHHGKSDFKVCHVRFYYENDNQWARKIEKL